MPTTDQKDERNHNIKLNDTATHQLIHQFSQNDCRAVGQDPSYEH